jgi:hypothetical protein
MPDAFGRRAVRPRNRSSPSVVMFVLLVEKRRRSTLPERRPALGMKQAVSTTRRCDQSNVADMSSSFQNLEGFGGGFFAPYTGTPG